MESSTAITVQWGPVEPCDQQNGAITGYSVRYGSENISISGDSSGGMTTITGLTPSTTYYIQMAAETSAGTGVYSDPLTTETPDSECVFWLLKSSYLVSFTSLTDVYLSLNGEVIPNYGYVEISDIGFSDTTALLCHTNRPPPDGSTISGGDWFAPDWTRVVNTDVSGFERNRGPMVVRLRRNSGTQDEGIYHCAIHEQGATSTTKVYVGLYNTGGGMSNTNGTQ